MPSRTMHWFPLGDELLQLDTATDHLCLVNHLAAEIVQLAGSGLDRQAIVNRLLQRYEVEPTRLHADVARVLEALSPPASVIFRDPRAHEAVLGQVPNRPLAPEACSTWHLPGFRITVRSESASLLQRLDANFRLRHQHGVAIRQVALDLYAEGQRFAIVVDGCDTDTGFGEADTVMKCHRVINLHCASQLPGTLFIHAAAVARNGHGLLLPAVGGSGKSTLSASLLYQGYQLMNDDIVSLTLHSQQLEPVPLALSIKPGSWPIVAAWQPGFMDQPEYGYGAVRFRYLAPHDEQVSGLPARCTTVVVPRYDPHHSGATLAPLAPVELLQALLAAGASLNRPAPPAEVAALACWLNAASAHHLCYSSLEDAQRVISSLLPDDEAPAIR